MSTRYLVRPTPSAGESLSSWRQRIAWANGYRLFPVLDERSRRADPDIRVSVREANWLSDLTTQSPDQIVAMTIEGARSEKDCETRPRHPLWVIPSMAPKAPRWGSVFCPNCLAEGAEPYFRRGWRMAYVLSCAKHKRWLSDSCQACGIAPWPTGSSVQAAMDPKYTSHAYCWACGYDLREGAGQQQADIGDLHEDAPDTMRRLLQGRIDPKTSKRHLLQGLHALSQLVIRTRRFFSLHRRNTIELYPFEIRKTILNQAFVWLHDWPNYFVSELTKVGISRADFNGQYASLPPWLKVVVDSDLARQNRTVSKAVAERTFLTLRSELGRDPKQADMRRVLGEAGDRYVRVLVAKRAILSVEEVQVMQERAIQLRQNAQKRADMLRAFKKGAICLNISVKSGLPLNEVVQLSATDLVQKVQESPDSLEGWLFGGVDLNVEEVLPLLDGTARQLLKLARGYLRSLMAPLADDLLRNEQVMRVAVNRIDVSTEA